MGGEFFRPGQPLKSDDLNSIVDQLMHQITGGKGINVATFGDRLIVSRKAEKDKKEVWTGVWYDRVAPLASGSSIKKLFGRSLSPTYDILISEDGGKGWEDVSPSPGAWGPSVLDCSSDGKTLAFFHQNNHDVYVSRDRGKTWGHKYHHFIAYWEVSVAAASTYVYATDAINRPVGTPDDYYLYRTSNGTTWTTVRTWQLGVGTGIQTPRVFCSPTGQYVMIHHYWNTYLSPVWFSDDYGVTWSANRAPTSLGVYQGAMSHSGQHVVIFCLNSTYVYSVWTSSDYGLTFTQKGPWPTNRWPLAGRNSCTISDDGLVITVDAYGTPSSNRYTMISNDGGLTWFAPTALQDAASNVGYLAADSTGRNMRYWRSPLLVNMKSSDYGVSWTDMEP